MRSILIVLLLATPAFSQGFYAVGEGLCWRPYSSDFQNYYDSALKTDHDWDAGVRAGVGFQHLLGFDVSWTYTWFDTDAVRTQSAPINAYTSYGDLDYQVHDFQVGRVYCLHPCFQLEPFAGFRWGQIDYSRRDTDITPNSFGVMNAHSFTDSYGLRLGAKGKLCLLGQLSLFGHGAVTGSFATTENRGTGWDVTDNHENHAVDAAAGLSWQCGFLEVASGYEWNWWADSIQRSSATSQPDYADLLLEGAFLRMTGRY